MSETSTAPKATPSQSANERGRIGAIARIAAGSLLALLALSWAPVAGIDDDVVTLSALLLVVLHWFLPPLTTSLVALGAFHLVYLSNQEKLRINGDGILWQDLVHVVPNVPFNLGAVLQYADARAIASVLLILCAISSIGLIEKRLHRSSKRVTAAFTLLIALIYAPGAQAYAARVFEDLAEFRKNGKAFAGNLHTSSIARFIHSASFPDPTLATDGTPASLFTQLAASLPERLKANVPNTPPDIFLVLNESQFDPMSLDLCSGRPDCRMEMYGPDTRLLQGGPLRVHTLGWGTWNAEFSLMTGVPYFWFGENGFYSPYTVSPRVNLALPKHLRTLGYDTMVIYPVQKGMINAAATYAQYGVQQFLGAEALELPFDWCETTDDLMYKKALERHRSAIAGNTRPVFLIVLTIFNHGPHGERCMSADLASRMTATDKSHSSALKVEDYIHRSGQVDKAAMAFAQRALQSSRPTIVAFVGDHQPGFEGQFAAYRRKPHREMSPSDAYFFTSYRILSNYRTKGEHGTSASDRELDISFFPSTLLELADLPEDSLFRANRQLRQLCSDRLDLCKNQSLLASYRQHLLDIGFFR